MNNEKQERPTKKYSKQIKKSSKLYDRIQMFKECDIYKEKNIQP